jgi:aromatic-amino-acid transaminase
MRDALAGLPARSIVVLHASCHNPTGVDLDAPEWEALVSVFKEKALVPFIDFAYQGFWHGIDEDAVGVRTFTKAGIPCVISSSFSKSFSLYRERVGAISFVTENAGEAKRVTSQVKRVIRTNYSNPSSHGAQVVALVLSDPELRKRWEEELAVMRTRIQRMRELFVERLAACGVTRDFSFITRQHGMLPYSAKARPRANRAEFGLYIVDSGRICVAAMNDKNIQYIAQSIAKGA